jgi:UPF0755 protein
MFATLSRQIKYGLVSLEIFLLLLIFALAYNFFLPLGHGRTLVYFQDTNTSTLLKALKQNGYNITDWDHFLIPKQTVPQEGWYHIGHTDEGRYHFFQQLGSTPAETMTIPLFSGETHTEMLHRLAKDMKLDEAILNQIYQARAHYEEADIFSGTYLIAREADENTTITHLFRQSHEKLEAFIRKYFTHQPDDYTIKLLLTIASIVQKESNDPKEMPLIASVIYNRLEKGMKLQMDGTLNYGKFSHTIVTPERIKNDTTFYNTYKYKGLPPAPLATVSLKALYAAMFPAETDYLFFMLNKDGTHNFSATYKEHLTHLRAFRVYLKARQEQQEKVKEAEEKKRIADLKKIKRSKDPVPKPQKPLPKRQ